MIGLDLVKIVAAIGKKAIWHVQGMKVPVEVLDVKVGYGKAFYLVKTGVGDATKWVSEDSVSVMHGVIKGTFEVIKEWVL